MNKQLIPFYREEEIYTLFYDEENNKMYRFSHRKTSPFKYIVLFLIVLYGSNEANGIYQNYVNPFINIIVFLMINILFYIGVRSFYKRYYNQDKTRSIFIDEGNLVNYANQGLKQFRIELYTAISLGILSLCGFLLFIVLNQLEPLIAGGMFFSISLLFVSIKPYRRYKLIRKFQRGEIEL